MTQVVAKDLPQRIRLRVAKWGVKRSRDSSTNGAVVGQKQPLSPSCRSSCRRGRRCPVSCLGPTRARARLAVWSTGTPDDVRWRSPPPHRARLAGVGVGRVDRHLRVVGGVVADGAEREAVAELAEAVGVVGDGAAGMLVSGRSAARAALAAVADAAVAVEEAAVQCRWRTRRLRSRPRRAPACRRSRSRWSARRRS